MKTRLKDVAEHLNLSSALVSGILNLRENVWASEETRARVFQAARDLNYGDYSESSGKRTPETALDLLLLGEAPGASALAVALARETTLSIHACPDESSALVWAATRPPAPTVVVGDPTLVANAAARLAPPFVIVGPASPGRGVSVDLDYPALASGALDHLRALGHRRIARLGEGPEAFRRGFFDGSCSAFDHADEVAATEASVEAALCKPAPPTAWVVAEAGAWGLLEACLARRDARLGFAPGQPAASGLHDGCALAFGQALAYDLQMASTILARAALQALRGEDAPRFVGLRLARATTFADLGAGTR